MKKYRATEQKTVAALLNPEGHDPGKETVTLINTGAAPEVLEGWRLEDKNGRSQILSGVAIGAGETVRLTLDPSGAQLANKGGRISLIDPGGYAVHTVSYSKGQARTDRVTILF